jgi:hypothetical protein
VDNLIVFHVPVHVLNLPSVPVNVSRDLVFVLTAGKSKMWTGLHSILIGPAITTPASAGDAAIVSVLD